MHNVAVAYKYQANAKRALENEKLQKEEAEEEVKGKSHTQL